MKKIKYTFTDITIYARTNDNNYVNLTDYQILETENEYRIFNSKAPFLLTFHSFFHNIYKSKGINQKLCEVTLEELKVLAGQCDESFYKRFVDSQKEINEQQIALFCAWKISDYHSGKCFENGETYEFYRVANKKENGSYKKYDKRVLTKKFFEA